VWSSLEATPGRSRRFRRVSPPTGTRDRPDSRYGAVEMRFRVLGPVEVAADERRLTLGSASQRLILAVLLAARGEVVSADRLIDAVWGERPPASARKSLHSHVSRLRRVLATRSGPDLAAATERTGAVATAPTGYHADLRGHELDAERFESLIGGARRQLAGDPQQAVDQLDDALALWRGPAFGEYASHPEVRAEAVRLTELRSSAAADRVEARLALGEHREVVAELQATVAAEPLAERAHGLLMLALYRGGRQADALAVYRDLQRRLAEEVGVDPSPEVAKLHQRILRQDAELVARPPRTLPRTPAPHVTNVRGPAAGAVAGTTRDATSRTGRGPPRNGDRDRLFGRDDEVLAVARLVAATALVTLTGPGGVGKTRLAAGVVAELRRSSAEDEPDLGGRMVDDVVVCDLAAVRDPASVPAALVGALGVQQVSDRSSQDAVLAALRMRRPLLVLDNGEHVLRSLVPLVERIRDDCPQVGVLTTSRQSLRLPGERVHEVAPLAVPRVGASAAEIAATPAGALFHARAQQVEPSFVLGEANAATVARLCRALDGLPLAIELAAARIRALAPEALAARIDDRFAVLAGGSHRQPARHRTLQAMVDWSYELLTPAEACLFDRLSVFAGPFSLEAAEQVCAGEPLRRREVAGLLAELVDKSLVTVDRGDHGGRADQTGRPGRDHPIRAEGSGVDGGRRYRLLDTLRTYGAERLEEVGATSSVRDAHAVHHVQLAEQLAAKARGPDEGSALARFAAVFDDLRIAHAWLVDRGEVDGAVRLPAALDDDLVFRPRAEVFAWAERAVQRPDAPSHPAYPAAMAVAARAALNRGELATARDLAEVARAAVGDDRRPELSARYVSTTAALYAGDLDEALAIADRRIAIADDLGDIYHRALAGVSRVLALRYRGEASAAVTAAAEARRDADASGNHTVRAWALYSNGEALLDTDPDAAAALLEQAIAAARRVDRRFIEGVALVSLASTCGRHGEPRRALGLFRDTIVLWRSLAVHTQQLTTLRNLVELFERMGADDAAAVLHGAVTADPTPSFGVEAARLAAAWARLEVRLGTVAARSAAERGRHLGPVEMVDEALASLEVVLRAAPPGREGDAPDGAPDRGVTDAPRGP